MQEIILPRMVIGHVEGHFDAKDDLVVDVKCTKCSWANIHAREYDAVMDLRAHFEHAHRYPLPLLEGKQVL